MNRYFQYLLYVVCLFLLCYAHVLAFDDYLIEREEGHRLLQSTSARTQFYYGSEPMAEWYEVGIDEYPIRFRLYLVVSGAIESFELQVGGHYVHENSTRELMTRMSLTYEEGKSLLEKKSSAIGFVEEDPGCEE